MLAMGIKRLRQIIEFGTIIINIKNYFLKGVIIMKNVKIYYANGNVIPDMISGSDASIVRHFENCNDIYTKAKDHVDKVKIGRKMYKLL